jgi:4-carboxymuconolactone decarboxylase
VSERLERLVPDRMDPAQLAVYRQITGGDRAKGPRHFPLTAEDGSLNGPFGVMLHAPGVGAVLQELGATIRSTPTLAPGLGRSQSCRSPRPRAASSSGGRTSASAGRPD